MTRDDGRSGRTARLDRRQFLSGTGTVALASLAGCADRFFGSDRAMIDGEALAEIVDGDAPTVAETLPVDLEASFVVDQRDAAAAMLDSVPAPFDEREIPNGVIRERLNDEYEAARSSIKDSRDASTPYARLERATYARTSANEVRVAWGAIEDEITADDLRQSASAVEDEVDAFASRWDHVGDDPVCAAVVHAEIEWEIRGARNWLSSVGTDLDRTAEQPLELGDIATDIERARTGIAVASYLFDRFRGSLADERPLRDRLSDAGDTLAQQTKTRTDSLPGEVDDATALVDRDIDETAGVAALSDLHREARYRAKDAKRRNSPSLATTVFTAASALVYLRAFQTLRDRIEDGDDVAITTIDDVRALRADAVDAVRTARDADRAPLVVDAVLPEFARELRWIDDRLSHSDTEVTVDRVAWDASGYVVVAETCRAVPSVSAEVASVLRGDDA